MGPWREMYTVVGSDLNRTVERSNHLGELGEAQRRKRVSFSSTSLSPKLLSFPPWYLLHFSLIDWSTPILVTKFEFHWRELRRTIVCVRFQKCSDLWFCSISLDLRYSFRSWFLDSIIALFELFLAIFSTSVLICASCSWISSDLTC